MHPEMKTSGTLCFVVLFHSWNQTRALFLRRSPKCPHLGVPLHVTHIKSYTHVYTDMYYAPPWLSVWFPWMWTCSSSPHSTAASRMCRAPGPCRLQWKRWGKEGYEKWIAIPSIMASRPLDITSIENTDIHRHTCRHTCRNKSTCRHKHTCVCIVCSKFTCAS